MKEPTYSDLLKSIKETKEELWTDETNKHLEKKYSPYLINRNLITEENILLLNEVNAVPLLDKKMHYEYVLHAIPKGQKYKYVQKRKTKLEKLQEELAKEYDKMKKGGLQKK